MADMGVSYAPATGDIGRRTTPGEWLEYSPLLTIVVCVLGFGYLLREVMANGLSVLLQLNHYIFLFLMVGLLLHWRPRSFVQAIAASVTPVGGVLIQYPMYAGIVEMLTRSGLAEQLSRFFVSIANEHTYPVLVGIYSAFLGVVHSVRRWQMADRSAVSARRGHRARGALGLGRADVQRDRGARESDSSVLDAAARRHPRAQGT